MKVLKKLGLKIRLDRPNIVLYPDIFRKIVQAMNKFWLILKLFKLNNSSNNWVKSPVFCVKARITEIKPLLIVLMIFWRCAGTF